MYLHTKALVSTEDSDTIFIHIGFLMQQHKGKLEKLKVISLYIDMLYY